jgi:OOP family OmpA-OmpF porin
MNPISLVLTLILVVWIGLGSYLYTCVYWQLCDGWTGANQKPVAEVKIDKPEPEWPTLSVYYKSGLFLSAENNFRVPKNTTDWKVPDASKFVIDSIKNFLKKNPGTKLEITGYYLPNEENKSKFENLGLARADAIAKLMADPALKNRFVLKGAQKESFTEKDNDYYDALYLKIFDDTPAPDIQLTEKETEILNAKHTVYFQEGSTLLITTPETEEFFKLLKNYLTKSPQSKITITGHTDNVGTAELNLGYGKNRAENVKKQLVARGLPASQIQTESKGLSEPIADNASPEGRQKNRRAEIVFQK